MVDPAMTDAERAHRGILVVISSPSGAGKTTLAHRAGRSNEKLEFSVSYTTRAPRAGERDGVDYKFVTEDEFTQMIERNEFAEWAKVHGSRYGTAVHTVNRALEDGKDYLFDIDYQGGAQIRRQWPAESVLVFILPPSMAELERRLRRRATDSPEAIERRLAMATASSSTSASTTTWSSTTTSKPRSRSCHPSMSRPAARAPRSGHLGHALLRRGAAAAERDTPPSSQ